MFRNCWDIEVHPEVSQSRTFFNMHDCIIRFSRYHDVLAMNSHARDINQQQLLLGVAKAALCMEQRGLPPSRYIVPVSCLCMPLTKGFLCYTTWHCFTTFNPIKVCGCTGAFHPHVDHSFSSSNERCRMQHCSQCVAITVETGVVNCPSCRH